MSSADEIPSDSLKGLDTRFDVCVVGAGIAGLTTAYLLAREGRRVLVIDDGPIGGTMTSRTTAHLASALDDRFSELERLHGERGARLAAASHAAAIDRIEQIVAEEGIDCGFERLDGYLFVPPGESTHILTEELEGARRAGLTGVELVDAAPISGFDTGECLRFPHQAQFHPLRYVGGLVRGIRRDGGRIVAGTHARAIHGGDPARVETEDGKVVTAGAVLVATNTPVNDRIAIHTKQAPYITYAIGARVPSDSVARALFWDTADPYHYVRLASGGPGYDHLIVGGEDHKTGQREEGAEPFAALESWARERFPMIESIDFRWSGQVMEPVDGLAFIGHNPLDAPNVYIATGDSGHGMTHGTIAGILITDLMVGRANEWEKLYDPARKTIGAVRHFAEENINVAIQYADLALPGEVESIDEIPPAHGAILRRGLHKLAVYRDENGSIHERSAICPHLGCVVRWNSTERSWDCPCHGSRYDPLGRVFQGPANSDLGSA